MAAKRKSSGIGVRLIGLSTALANAGDVAEWLGVKEVSVFFNELSVYFLHLADATNYAVFLGFLFSSTCGIVFF